MQKKIVTLALAATLGVSAGTTAAYADTVWRD
jgi:hypothetical protein